MGRRGPKPKSPTLKILEGNAGRRALEDGSPQVPAGIPRCPSRYDGVSRYLWKSLGRKLATNGILTRLDVFALELLVDAYYDYQSARANEDQKLIEKTQNALRVLLREFGLTPASRSSVKAADKADEKKPADPAARYFA
jgi:phage terminase small subunit